MSGARHRTPGTFVPTAKLPQRPMLVLVALALAFSMASAGLIPGFRPPSVPLIVNTPYLSIWQNYDNLTDGWLPQHLCANVELSLRRSTHWTGTIKALCAAIRIDGTPYRFMGVPGGTCVVDAPLQQISVQVYPTQTYYVFQQAGIELQVVFTTPSVGAAFETIAHPFSYITYNVSSIDGAAHSVQIYFDNTAEMAVTDVDEEVTWNNFTLNNNGFAMNFGTTAQDLLGQTTDMIDWGYQYTAVTLQAGVSTTIAGSVLARSAFANNQPLPAFDTDKPRECSDNWPVLAIVYDLSTVQPNVPVSRFQVYAYDEILSIDYFGMPLQPYWRHLYQNNTLSMLQDALANYASFRELCNAFDAELVANLTSAGGDTYATLTSLAYRQATGATAVVWNPLRELVWMFMKEISSDGDVSTVDVVFPSSPLFMYLAPESMRLVLLPILAYANNETNIPYNLAWSPHHLGTWPICDITPGQQEQMPMEETGNMLLMLASIAKRQNGDVAYLAEYSHLLNIWWGFLNSTLPDPGNQLCTDDFEGPSPNNSNLAIKGIEGLGAYAMLLDYLGYGNGSVVLTQAQAFVGDWLVLANSGNHYMRQYNTSATWSLKYNLMYQYLLGLPLFPESVIAIEEIYYQEYQLNTYGVPLDDRATFTKTDWLSWIAAMGSQAQFDALFQAIYRFADETPSRVPFSDWYDTISSNVVGFRARPVIGGLYAHILLETFAPLPSL